MRGSGGFTVNGVGRDGNQDKKKIGILTKETVGMTLLLFSLLILFITITGPIVFGGVGTAVASFFYGVFGYFVYPLLLLTIVLSLSLVSGKRLIPVRWILRSLFLLVAVFYIVHTATAERFFAAGYGGYLEGCWSAPSESLAAATGGGVLFGLLGYPIRLLLSEPGAYVLFSVLTLAALFLLFMLTPLSALIRRPVRPRKRKAAPDEERKEIRHSAEEYVGPDPASAPVAFEDLASPTRTAMPSYGPYSASRERSYSSDSAQKPDLFEDNPRDIYRRNLFFDNDSDYNKRRRNADVGTDAVASRPQTPPESYTGQYSQEEEQGRTQMPRRVTSVPPQDFTDRDESLNYPQTPPYRPVFDGEKDAFPDAAQEPPRYGFGREEERPDDRAEPFDRNNTLRDPYDTGRGTPDDRAEPFDRNNVLRDSYDSGRTPDDRAEPFDRNNVLRDPYDSGRGTSEDRAEPFDRNNVLRDPYDTGRGTPDDRAEPFDRSRTLRDPYDAESGDDTFDRGSRTGSDRSAEGADLFDDASPLPDENADALPSRNDRSIRGLENVEERALFDPAPRAAESVPESKPEPAKPKPKKKHVWKKYKSPDISLLNDYDGQITLSNEEVGRTSGIIIDTLQHYKINTHVIGVKGGASVTRYDLAMPESGTISMVTRYADELAVYLEVSGVNMYANPAVRGISVEVPNKKRATIGLKTLIQSPEFTRAQKPDAVVFALGQNIDGEVLIGDITEMTHILVAGTTGSGKSVAIHAMLISMLYKYSPEELRLILIDPKQTEFIIYEGLPHLMINEIISQPQKAVTALSWACKEMDRRYTLFMEKTRSGVAVSKIDEYNNNLAEGEERLPKIIIVVDEFADLMLTAQKDIEEKVQRLAQKARAAGLHLVLATQRPDSKVITGVIKSNLPTRIALSVDSDLNSRIMLDESGAEKLLGKGDMFIKMNGKPRRAQGAYITVSEIQRVVGYIKENNETYFDDEVTDYIDKAGSPSEGSSPADFADDGEGGTQDVYINALAIVVKLGQASISLIQRKCAVGYNRAGKIIEWMESMGYISEFDGKAKARTVLLTQEEFDEKYGGNGY